MGTAGLSRVRAYPVQPENPPLVERPLLALMRSVMVASCSVRSSGARATVFFPV